MAKKLFGTDGVRGVANVYPLTADFALNLAKACADLLCQKHKKVAIAKDTRVSGDMLEAALTAGFTAQGIDVVKLGVLPTPAVTMVVSELQADMAVMITASHNPYQDNGIKLINAAGDKFSDEVTSRLEELVAEGVFAEGKSVGRVYEAKDGKDKYLALIGKVLSGTQPLKGLKVVLDCANGCFSDIMPEVYRHLGAEVTAIADHPDGYNINRDCGSQHVEALCEAVKARQADIGIAADGDGDRIIVVNEKGEKVNAEQVIAYLAKYLQEKGRLNGRPVVSTVLSNTALETYIRSLGVAYYSTKVGERHVISKMQEVGGSVGGEESGHMVVADYSKTGDALVVSLMICKGLSESGKKMSELFPLFDFDPFVFVNPRFASHEQIKRAMEDPKVIRLIEESKKAIEGQGRVVVRVSGTEPLIRIWVGGKDADLVQRLSRQLVAEISKFQ